MEAHKFLVGPIAALALAGALTLTGCGDGGGNNVLAPQFQPQVTNAIDDFSFQATGVDGVTQTLDYAWRNTGTQANVNQACSIVGGSATLVLRDSTGAQVYSRNLADNGTFVTLAGEPSRWSMRIVLTNVRGTLNFRVQKKT
jgi:hypothetical protein